MLEIYGKKRIREIANQLNLPEWWVESVIIEYLPCRRYAESEWLWTFDFCKLTDEDINKIHEKKVVISSIFLVQNVRPEDFLDRSHHAMAGVPYVPSNKSAFVSNGFANSTCFPFRLNNISVQDDKLGFSKYSTILDDGVFYQWDVAEYYGIQGETRGWYKSNLFNLNKLDKINQELVKYWSSNLIKNPTPEFVKNIEKKYEELESERQIIRKKIWEYHCEKKKNLNVTQETVNIPAPPKISYFETIKWTGQNYKIRTHMEPLFLRSAVKHMQLADTAHKQHKKEPGNVEHNLEEIEHSAMCIISAASCIEAYTDYIMEEYFPDEYKSFSRMGIEGSLIFLSYALDLPKKFKRSESPLSGFRQLTKWRNKIIHSDARYKVVAGKSSTINSQIRLQNAKRSIKIILELVTALSSSKKIPLPNWIQTTTSWEYWNDVRDCLKHCQT